MCVWRMLIFGEGGVVIPVDTQKSSSYLHSLAWRDVMNHVYLQELQSGSSHVASSARSMLG